MFRPKSDFDISDKELSKYVNPHYKRFDNYLFEYIVPDAIAFYLATGYYNDALFECKFDSHINTVLDMLNQVCLPQHTFNTIKKRTVKALKIKHGLTVINEDPLDFKKN